MSNSASINKWAEGFEIECAWECDVETKGWERSDGERVIETNGDPIWERDEGFAEAWEAQRLTFEENEHIEYSRHSGREDFHSDG